MIGTAARAAEVLLAADDILILTHRRPDGDTTGSAGALCTALRKIGKTAYVADNEEVTKRYAQLIVPFAPNAVFEPKCIVSVDCADRGMIAPAQQRYADRVDLAIDHHRSNDGFGKDNLIMPERAACAEIVLDVIEAMGIELDAQIAYGIYVGTSTDTGCFKFSNTTSNTHIVAAKCLDAGVDGGEINRALFETKSHARFEMERILFSDMKFYHDGAVAAVVITLEDRQKTGADHDDLDAIASLPRQIEGVEVGLTITELKKDVTKVSVRTTKEVDAASVCELLGGGGHIRAAGATIEQPLDKAMPMILAAVEKVYCGETN